MRSFLASIIENSKDGINMGFGTNFTTSNNQSSSQHQMPQYSSTNSQYTSKDKQDLSQYTFRPVNFYCIKIGELIRKSKTRTSWHFDLDNIRYQFELEHSVVTGKKKLLRNNCLIHQEKNLRKMYAYELHIGEHILNFTQQGDKFDLRIDNESFSYVYNRIRQQGHFVYEDEDQKNDNESQNNAQQIQKNINFWDQQNKMSNQNNLVKDSYNQKDYNYQNKFEDEMSYNKDQTTTGFKFDFGGQEIIKKQEMVQKEFQFDMSSSDQGPNIQKQENLSQQDSSNTQKITAIGSSGEIVQGGYGRAYTNTNQNYQNQEKEIKKKKIIDDEDEYDEDEAWADVKKAKEEVLGKQTVVPIQKNSFQTSQKDQQIIKKHQPQRFDFDQFGNNSAKVKGQYEVKSINQIRQSKEKNVKNGAYDVYGDANSDSEQHNQQENIQQLNEKNFQEHTDFFEQDEKKNNQIGFEWDFSGMSNQAQQQKAQQQKISESKINQAPKTFDFDAIPTFREIESSQIESQIEKAKLINIEDPMEAPRGDKERQEDLRKDQNLQQKKETPMVFDFENYGVKPLIAEGQISQNLIEIANAPQSEFDFDYQTQRDAVLIQAQIQNLPQNQNLENDLLSQSNPSIDEMLRKEELQKEQEKNDKIQQFLNKQFSQLTVMQKSKDQKQIPDIKEQWDF